MRPAEPRRPSECLQTCEEGQGAQAKNITSQSEAGSCWSPEEPWNSELHLTHACTLPFLFLRGCVSPPARTRCDSGMGKSPWSMKPCTASNQNGHTFSMNVRRCAQSPSDCVGFRTRVLNSKRTCETRCKFGLGYLP